MTMWRLESIAPEVAQELAAGPARRLRLVATRVAKAALSEVPVDEEPVDKALAALDSERFGEGAARDALKRLADALDEAAWDLQDRVEEGSAAQSEYLVAFSRARAVMALWFALEADPLTAAMEAAYEAEAATDDQVLRQVMAAVA